MNQIFQLGDALLKIAPHNVLLVLTSNMNSLSKGDAKPKIIKGPGERGAKPYLAEIY